MTDRYKVVINHEEQYKIIPADQPLLRGWRETGKLGSDRDCLKYIEEVWTDMTPAELEKIKYSLRRG